jgi:hypothetical protein
MKKFLPLFLCLLLSVFTAAHATKPPHTLVLATNTSLNDANTDEEVTPDDDDSVGIGPNDEGEDFNDDYAGEDTVHEDTGDDDGGNDDEGDDYGSDEGE